MAFIPVLDLQIEVRPNEAARYLGYPDGHHRPARGADRLDELLSRAVTLLEPRGAWTVIGRAEAAATAMPGPAERVGIGVVTIGPRLEAEVERCIAEDAILDALVFDAIGSAAAEAAADALNLKLCAVARSLGLEAAARVSPGYGSWDTASQRPLLALLPIAELGISLTSGAMMVPRKSVSFAANFAPPGAFESDAADRCARCGLPRCRHRIAPADCG